MPNVIETLNKMVIDGSQRGLVHHFTTDEKIDSAKLSIEGETMTNFGSCSYLGLEYHPALAKGVIDATQRYGTQFSSSRMYLSIGLYAELKEQLSSIFEKPVLVSASTTLGHMAALPSLIEDDDAIIIDLQVHSSVQLTTQVLKARKVPVYVIPQ